MSELLDEPVQTSRHDDTEVRERALATSSSFIVRAPAGSGKTELLAQRFLALLAVVEAPEEVLAITFTVKAAGEMRARILAALERAQSDTAPATAHLRRTWELARRVKARDADRAWQLQDNPARLRVQTIDALCAGLAHRLPVLARFGAAPRVTDDAEPLYREAARMLLQSDDAALDGDLRVLLQHIDNDFAAAERLITQMLAERDRWLRHLADVDHPALQREALEAGLGEIVTCALAELRAAAPAGLEAVLPALADYAAGHLQESEADSPIAACAGLSALPGTADFDLAPWRGVRALLLTETGELRSRLTSRQGFPAASSATDPAERERRSVHKQRMEALLAELSGADQFLLRLHAVRELPPTHYTDDQWQVTRSLVALLPHAVAALKLVFERDVQVDFVEMAHAALRALGDPQQPTDLALVLDYQLRHVLVDEFQDTSFTQLELLDRLTAGWEQGDGRTLFLVGDPMQSIYRFREAEVALFSRVEARGIASLHLEPLFLRRNFRARRGLVEWVNDHFERLFHDGGGAAEGAVRFEPAEAVLEPLDGPAVSVYPQFATDPWVEAECVAGLIREARRERPRGSIAVLVRARQHLAAILPRLRADGLRFRALEIEPLADEPVVQDVYALTRALLHLGDRVAWLAILRAPWCGLTLSDLSALVEGDRAGTVWDAIVDGRRRRSLSADGQLRLARVEPILAVSLAQRGRRPLRRWVEGAWMALGGAACLTSDAQWMHARQFLRLLEGLAADERVLERLEEGLARLYAEPDPLADDTLQVMTIHRAKGLEFDTVILPGLGSLPGRSAERLLTVWERPRGALGVGAGSSRLLMAPLSAPETGDPIGRYVKHLDRLCDRNEQVRLLYVAATRARQRLHLLGCARLGREQQPAPASESLLARLWPVLGPQFEAEIDGASGLAAAVIADGPGVEWAPSDDTPVLRRLDPGWQLERAPQLPAWAETEVSAEEDAPHIAYLWASDLARHVGVAVHRILQRVGVDGLPAWEELPEADLRVRVCALLTQLGVPQHALEEATQRACTAVRNTLGDERGRWIFDTKHTEPRSEYALSGWLDGRLVSVVIDRTFIDRHGVRWIVDFKTGVHEGAAPEHFLDEEMERYRSQLARYAALMHSRDGREARVGLYFPMLCGWRDWDPRET